MTPADQLDGLAFVEGVRDGRWPADPFMVSLGIRVTEAARGRVVMEATPGGDHLNLGGIVHGGYLSALMDSATGFALHSTLAPGDTPPHLAASYRFLSMAWAGEALIATASVLKAGSRIGHVRVEVRDAAGRLMATGETTHAVVAVPAPPSGDPSR
jgi:acyl-CoA thioesterase